MPEDELIGLTEIPELSALTLNTVYFYRSTGRLPAPDMMIGRKPAWKRSTISRWEETRTKR